MNLVLCLHLFCISFYVRYSTGAQKIQSVGYKYLKMKIAQTYFSVTFTNREKERKNNFCLLLIITMLVF